MQVLPGPVVTMYEFEPASGVKVSRIVNLADDLALGMKALSVRIVAPVPGKSVVGIEVPNPQRQPVYLREIVASPAFRQAPSKLVLALGKDILGTPDGHRSGADPPSAHRRGHGLGQERGLE